MQQLQVRYFSRLREIVDRSSESLFVDISSTIGDVVTALVCKYPALAPLRTSLLIARNAEYASLDEQVNEGDVIDLMPPVSGG